MPYTDANDKELPEYIKKQAPELREAWVRLFNIISEDHGEDIAFLVANKWLMRQHEKKEVVARTMKYATVKFELKKGKELISRTIDGEDYVEFMLTDVFANEMGETYSEEVLKDWAEDINKKGIIGDIDHEEYDRLIEMGLSTEEISKRLLKKQGIAKSVNAVVNKGQLWVRAMIDKRYKKIINNSKGVSLEALVEKDENNRVIGGDIVGFTFGVNQEPVNNRAKVDVK